MSAVSDTFARAWRHHQANELPRAEQLYREVLSSDATHADAWCFLGAACQSQGRKSEAESAYREAIRLVPSHSSALNCLGVLLAEGGNLPEGAECFKQILRFHPGDAEAHNNLGQVHARLGNVREAITCYRTALDFSPQFAPARHNLNLALQQLGTPQELPNAGFMPIVGGVHQSAPPRSPPPALATGQDAYSCNLRGVNLAQQGLLEEAMLQFERALLVDPVNPDAHNNLGNLLDMQGRVDEAASRYMRALQVRPDYIEAHYNLGIVRAKQGRVDESCACYLEAIRLRPEHVDAMNNLGIALMELGKTQDAAIWLRRALKHKPSYADAWNNLGNVLEKQGDLEEASHCYLEAMRNQPRGPIAYNNLGNIRKQQGRFDEALKSYAEAVRLDDNFAEAHFNRALLWLLMENWKEGWPEYDWRWKTKDFPRYSFRQPRWQGEPLADRTLLLLAEQGLGDTIQFIRFVSNLRPLGGRVIVQCHAPLRPLLEKCVGISDLVEVGAPMPHFDLYAPLMSVPGILGIMPKQFPDAVPYVRPGPSLVEHWRKELASVQGFKVGIAWQGRPTYRGDRLRSIPLEHFRPLAEIPRVKLISLQKGVGQEQLGTFPKNLEVHDLGSRLDESGGAFMDTAAVMKNLDLVISSDTAIVHLAGALGVPVWVALNMIPDWRWFLHRMDTPWYPTMHLFRQREIGRWDDVFLNMSRELKALATGLAN